VGAVVGARKSAERTVDLIQVRQAIQLFQAGEERLPTSLQELVSEGYLPRLPDPPSGQRFEYDGRLGQVKLVPAPAGR
jgi:competence protein ComGC